MALGDHLRELRNRLAVSLLGIAVCVVVAFVFWEPIYEFLREPYCSTSVGERTDCELVSLGIFDQFKVRLRVSMIAGIVAAAPIWLYQLGAFITPALYGRERKYAAGFLAASLVLFAVGAVLAYLTISQGLDFLLKVGGGDINVLVSIQSYLSFLTLCLLAFGVAFLFPVVVTFLNMVGAFPSTKMRAWRRGMVVGIFAASALITPSQDPFTFVLMAVPITLLYEGCIVIARLRERAVRRRLASDPIASLGDDETSPLDAAPGPLDDASPSGEGARSLPR